MEAGIISSIVLAVLLLAMVAFGYTFIIRPSLTSDGLTYAQQLNQKDFLSRVFPRSTTRDQYTNWIQENLQGSKPLKDFIRANKS
jgi:hypothetical protein